MKYGCGMATYILYYEMKVKDLSPLLTSGTSGMAVLIMTNWIIRMLKTLGCHLMPVFMSSVA
jgi:hypothetical protein